MPRRKKSTVHKKTGISINIKNILSQRQAPDIVRYRKNPNRNLNLGNRFRAINPSLMFASPPSYSMVSSINPLVAAEVPRSVGNSQIRDRPDLIGVEANPRDIEQAHPAIREVPAKPIVPTRNAPYNDPIVHALPPNIEPVPLSIPSLRLSEFPVRPEAPVQNEAQRMMAGITLSADDWLSAPPSPPRYPFLHGQGPRTTVPQPLPATPAPPRSGSVPRLKGGPEGTGSNRKGSKGYIPGQTGEYRTVGKVGNPVGNP